MIQIPKRLAAMAEYIHWGESVADIGTDHGLLPIFLFNQKISPKVILSDIRPGPLEKAKANLLAYSPEMAADLRLGNGLETLRSGEVDTVVIAGMGGMMITEILAKDQKKTRSFRKYILQPRNGQDKLRIWLYKNGYTVNKERLVKEGNHICEIIVVDTTQQPCMEERKETFEKRLCDLEFEFSPLLFFDKDPLLKELIECRIKIEQGIIASIRQKGSHTSFCKLANSEIRVNKLNELCRKV
ncbi:MAG TPA: class I SAM-dependent methyltransferase [Bacillota bacterium]|jgi:tRNA (adenine22-N1)-methyltransferase|nr:class I SAM-dependent methyltransferase [Bacillota bacterium]